jgi:hypothetical protein
LSVGQLSNLRFASEQYAVGYAIALSTLCRFDYANIFALGEDNTLPVSASFGDDRIKKLHDGDGKIT